MAHSGRFCNPEAADGGSRSGAARADKEELAEVLEGMMEPGVLYLLGPGTTVGALMERLGIDGTLLGVDAVADGRLVQADVNERDMLALFERYPHRRIIVTPIGGNGFLFGRGSKQFTPEVLRQVGREHIVVTGERSKIDAFDCLRVDTGDDEVDGMLRGVVTVLTGRNEETVLEVKA